MAAKKADDMMEFIKIEGVKNYPKESCGLILKDKAGKSITVSCKNISDAPRQNFVIDPEDYADAAERGEVIGVWHTHIEIPSRASDADKVGCERTQMPWFIVSVRKATQDRFEFEGPTVINPSGFEMPYLERPYVPGVLDCYSLAQDYYRIEHGIILGNYPIRLPDGSPGYKQFVTQYEKEGFVRLINEELKSGDSIIMQIATEHPSHWGIYLGDGVFMHHQHGRLSRKDIYGGMWQKHTTHHLRHKRLM